MPLVNIHTHRHDAEQLTLRTAGIHPWSADAHDTDDAVALRMALGSALDGAQAIGETGLDFVCTADRNAQQRLFRAHAMLAQQLRLPMVVHCVRAFEPTMKILGDYDVPTVVFHGFIGSPQQAQQAVRRGYYLSFGVRSLHSPRTVEAMRAIPPERLFVETDDDPVTVGDVYRMAAEVLGISVERLAQQTRMNYKILTDNG